MRLRLNKKSGFTLLEIIIVIIIVGVLASLALPRFFSTVEFAKSTEALASIGAIRQAMERCYLASGGSYATCGAFNVLDLEDPADSPGNHFTYSFPGTETATNYTIRATRNTYDGGDGSSQINVTQSSTGVTRSGTAAFAGIK